MLGPIFLIISVILLAVWISFFLDYCNYGTYGWFVLVINILTAIISILGFIYDI
jgi:hypothetical protein